MNTEERGTAKEVVKCLKENELDRVFMMMGGAQSLWYECQRSGIQIVQGRSENATAYMADGFARTLRRPSVVYAQWGPGASNLAGALADAYWARSPLVALTLSIGPGTEYRGNYQEIDQMPMFDPVTKWNRTVPQADRTAEMLGEAIRVAAAGSPRPVHLDLPRDFIESTDVGGGSWTVEPPTRPRPDDRLIERAVEMLAGSKRPMILAGNGVILSRAEDELARLVKSTGIPVATSLNGKGSFDESDALSLGVVGHYASTVANELFAEADLVVVLGSGLGSLITNDYRLPSDGVPIVQIDLDGETIGSSTPVSLAIQADARAALEVIRDRLEAGPAIGAHASWGAAVRDRMASWRSSFAEIATREGDGVTVAGEAAMHVLRQHAADDDILVADTGNMAAWTGVLFPVRKTGRRFLRAAGSLGWAFPAALGAQMAEPNSRVFAVSGDGGVAYHIGMLEAAIRFELPVVLIVLNNDSLAYEWQGYEYVDGFMVKETTDFAPVRYADVAEAYGALGIRVRTAGEFSGALERAIAQRRPALIEVVAGRDNPAPLTSFEGFRDRVL